MSALQSSFLPFPITFMFANTSVALLNDSTHDRAVGPAWHPFLAYPAFNPGYSPHSITVCVVLFTHLTIINVSDFVPLKWTLLLSAFETHLTLMLIKSKYKTHFSIYGMLIETILPHGHLKDRVQRSLPTTDVTFGTQWGNSIYLLNT